MSQAVMIKSSRNGISLILDSELEFTPLLDEILKKFRESEKFFGNAEFALSFEGRDLSDEEKCQIADEIMNHTRVKILCIIDNDEIKDAVLQQKMLAKLAPQDTCRPATGTFYHGSLNPDEHLELDDAVIILGDVAAGAAVVSKSSIIVLGALNGKAYAGMDGDSQAFIAALEFTPEQYNIAGVYGTAPERERVSLFSKRNKTAEAKIAVVSDGIISVRPLDAGWNNYI